MSFLHFETRRFCTNILFYDFCMNPIEISQFWKFMMMQTNCIKTLLNFLKSRMNSRV